MIKAHKIRLNPKSEQESYFYCASGVARTGWNWALDEYKRRKAAGQEISWNEIKIEFRARIKTEFPFVREVTKGRSGVERTGVEVSELWGGT
jgi:hypothetical protein